MDRYTPVVLRDGRQAAESYPVTDDALLIRLYNSLASATFKVVARVLTPAGVLRVVQQVLTTASDRTQQLTCVYLPAGQLLSAAVIATAQTPRRGQAWAIIAIESTLPTGVVFLTPLAQGYVTADSALLWPGGAYPDSVEGPGILRSVTGTNPAAGVEVIEAVPTDARWRIRALRASLVTDATVATRTVNIIIDDGATTLLNFPGVTTQTATLTRAYNVAEYGFQPAAVGTDIFFYIPFVIALFQGWRIRTSTTNIQAGDNWGAPQLEVEEWIEE